MKKISLLLLVLFLSCKINAQVYYPMLDSVSNTWYFVSNIVPVSPPESVPVNCLYAQFPLADSFIYSTQGDTVISGNTYKILIESDYLGSSQTCTYGYIREDTSARKIFFIDNIFTPEELLYDFSMQVGDSINLSFYQGFGIYTSGIFTLDSITTINIPAGMRNLYHLYNHSQPFSPPLQWIEGVGHPGHIIYTKSCNSWGGFFSFSCFDQVDRNFCQMLTCFEHTGTKVYFDSCAHQNAINNFCVYYADSCNYWNICGSVVENLAITSFYVSPNPATDASILTIKLSRNTEATIFLKDGEGRTILPTKKTKLAAGENKIPLSLKNLSPGIYFIELNTSEKSFYKKLVVSR